MTDINTPTGWDEELKFRLEGLTDEQKDRLLEMLKHEKEEKGRLQKGHQEPSKKENDKINSLTPEKLGFYRSDGIAFLHKCLCETPTSECPEVFKQNEEMENAFDELKNSGALGDESYRLALIKLRDSFCEFYYEVNKL